MTSPPEHTDIAIVGAGQAGLTLSYYLKKRHRDVLLIDRADALGASWARRWDSLRLFTPARYSSLPGLAFPGEPWSHPGKDEVANYLANFAAHHELPIRTGQTVTNLSGRYSDFRLLLNDGHTLHARQVVIATGAFGEPFIPPVATDLSPDVLQIHSDEYRNPQQITPNSVVVVGGGNSGFQIAHELVTSGYQVVLSEGTRARTVPQRILGRDLFWWLTTSRLITASSSSRIGQRLRANEPVIGVTRKTLQRAGVVFRGRTTAAQDRRITFSDGHSSHADTVIWATGHRHRDQWVQVPGVLDQAGTLKTHGLATPAAGLYAIGRPWQRSRGSALLGYVSRDAEELAQHLQA